MNILQFLGIALYTAGLVNLIGKTHSGKKGKKAEFAACLISGIILCSANAGLNLKIAVSLSLLAASVIGAPFIQFNRKGGLDAYLMLGKYAAVFTDYEDAMEYDREKGIITKFFNGGHSVTYLAEDFRITSVEGEAETAALRVPCIGPAFQADSVFFGLSGMRAGRKTRFILPSETLRN